MCDGWELWCTEGCLFFFFFLEVIRGRWQVLDVVWCRKSLRNIYGYSRAPPSPFLPLGHFPETCHASPWFLPPPPPHPRVHPTHASTHTTIHVASITLPNAACGGEGNTLRILTPYSPPATPFPSFLLLLHPHAINNLPGLAHSSSLLLNSLPYH